jgi:hypothetical protein
MLSTSNIIGWWPMRGDGHDASGRGHDVNAEGGVPQWISTDRGLSWQGKAVTSVYFRRPADGTYWADLSNKNWTISWWVAWDDPTVIGSLNMVVGQWNNPGYNWHAYFDQQNANFYNTNDGNNGFFLPKTLRSFSRQWFHFAFVFIDGTLTFYWNGDIIGTPVTGMIGPPSADMDFWVGNIASYYNDNLLSDIMILNKGLSQIEVREAMNSFNLT